MRLYISLLLIILMLPCIQIAPGHSWVYQTCGSVTMRPIVHRDRVYFYSHDGGIYCLYPETGDLVWRTQLDIYSIDSLTAGKKTIVVTNSNIMYAFDMGSGERKWELSLGEEIKCVVSADEIYAATKNSLVCVDKKKGEVSWCITLPDMYERNLFTFKDRLFVDEADNILGCYTENGEKLWEFDTGNGYAPPGWVFVEDDTVLFLSEKLYKLDIRSGEKIWMFESDHWLSNPLLVDNTVVVSSEDSIVCLNRSTGEIVWEKMRENSDFDSEVLGVYTDENDIVFLDKTWDMIKAPDGVEIVRDNREPLLISDRSLLSAAGEKDKVILSSADGVFCFDVLNGKRMWKYTDNYFHRAVSIENERVYITSDDGKIYSFPLDSEDPLQELPDYPEVDYSELGDVKSIYVNYFISYCTFLVKGEVSLEKKGDLYEVVSGYEWGGHHLKEKWDFEGTLISTDIVDAFYTSITDLYTNSWYKAVMSTAFANIFVVLELETGEAIVLKSGENLQTFIPWEVQFRGARAVQYSGRISSAFYELMNEIGWSHKKAEPHEFWWVATSGCCRPPVTLLEVTDQLALYTPPS